MAAPCWTTTSRSSNKGSHHGCDQKSGLRSSSRWAATVLLFAAFAPVVTGLAEKECKLDSFRLPRRVQPTNYKLLLRPNLDTWSYSAELTIKLQVHEEESGSDRAGTLCELPSLLKNLFERRDGSSGQLSPACDRSKIILHADPQLNIGHVDYITNGSSSEKQQVQVSELCRDLENEFLVVSLGQELAHGTTGELTLHFSGPIRDDKLGFYRSKHYLDPESGDQRYMAMTQFESSDARKAFPCFDEPDFKSTFDLVIEHASHLQALSNMHAIKEESIVPRRGAISAVGGATEMIANEDDESVDEEEEKADDAKESSEEMTRVTFAQTPRMSTYLLAFALGHFNHIETRVGNLRLAFWTAPNQAQLANYALGYAARAYESLRDYLTIEQPLEKIDFLAVGDFGGISMENWGLITFRDSVLLLDEHNTSLNYLVRANNAMAISLANQWLGNLVTMKWWNDIWLNQGLADWVAKVVNQQLHPDRDIELVFLAYPMNAALKADASHRTHPIRNKRLESTKEIVYDSITSRKASAVIQMLHDYLGPANIKRGIHNYLANNSYQNTETLDLWAALDPDSSLGVRDFMTSWIDQPGFPIIRAQLTEDGRSLRIEQERFLKYPPADKKQKPGTNMIEKLPPAKLDVEVKTWQRSQEQKWTVPVTMWVSDGNKKTEMMNLTLCERSAEIKFPSWFEPRKPGHWLKLNARFTGFYRVQYKDESLLQALREPIEQKLLEPSDRVNIICDSLALAANAELDMETLKEVLNWFKAEDNDVLLRFLKHYKDFLGLLAKVNPFRIEPYSVSVFGTSNGAV